VRYVGDAIAAVAAETAAAAQAGLDAIVLELEALPVVSDMTRALDAAAPVIPDWPATLTAGGLGVGIVARMAIEADEDRDLVSLDASHLFPAHVTWIGFGRGALLRKFMYEFMQLFAPHLNRRLVDRAQSTAASADVDKLFADIELPLR
jgi:hypothetical protein